MGNEQGKLQGVPTPAGIQSMDESLQKKFAKGIQYNMKIVIRGDRNTGKTKLFHRMEGKPFNEAYLPTNEIQVTSILWSYRVTNDTVKVEIWDVVDKGRALKARGSKGLLKMFNSPDAGEEEEEGKALDASFLDVYKGAHGVVFTFDITKQWTWKYIERELPQVPLHIPVIILANFMDLSEHRLVSKEECMMLIATMNRPDGAADIRYAECSMKNGFGLMHLHKFLSVPFLQLQQETLLQQLQVNREQTLAAMEELDAARSSEDQNYSLYLAKIQRLAEEKRLKSRQQQEQSPEEGVASPVRRDTMESKSSNQSDTPPRTHPAADPTPPPSQQPPSSKGAIPRSSGSITSKFSSKFAGFMGKGKEEAKKVETKIEASPNPKEVSPNHVAEFVPEGSVDFLEDEEDDEDTGYLEEEGSDEDSDDTGNPMIAADEDLSSPEELETAPSAPKSTTVAPKVMDSPESSDEEPPTKAPLPQKSPPKKKAALKPLKSALDIELTDSEKEEEEKEDDDIDGGASFGKGKTKRQSNGTSKNLEDIFEPSPLSSRKKNSGLMLQFSSTAAVKAPAISKDTSLPGKGPTPTSESPDRRKREKKKKSKRSKRSKEEANGVEDGGKGTAVTPAGSAITGGGGVGGGATGNPYDAIASLDAWLNSDSNALDDFLTPTQAAPPQTAPPTGGVEVGVEEGEEESQPRKRSSSSSKKHKHKKRSEGVEGDGESKKKKHGHKSARHRSLDQPAGDYQLI